MRPILTTALVPLFAGLIMPLPGFGQAAPAAVAAGQGNPAVSLLKDDISHYVSFDKDSLTADIGDLATKGDSKDKVFQSGKFGKALLIPGGGTSGKSLVDYTSPAHPWAKGAGAVSLWVAPVAWTSVEDVEQRGLIVMLRMAFQTGGFFLERQGIIKGTPGRTDLLIAGLDSVSGVKNAMLVPDNTSRWKNGAWHLIVVNWDWNGIEVSLDGKPFKRVEFTRPLTGADIPQGKDALIQLGGGDADPAETTLVDEMVIYKRKLTGDEVMKILGRDDDE